MSEKCLKCFRPMSTCYCSSIKPVCTKAKFVFLMHPKEAYRQHTGTGRLASLSLPGSEIIVGIDFTQNKRLNELINDPAYYPLILFPHAEAVTASHSSLSNASANGKKLLIIIIDSTWFFAKKILRLSVNLMPLPKLSFEGSYESQFVFKKQPAPECVSTIESCYYLLKEMQSAGLEDSTLNLYSLMEVFKKMVNFQLQAEQERLLAGIPGRHSYDASRDAKRIQKIAKKNRLQENPR